MMRRSLVIAGLAGSSLILAQFTILRELAALMGSNELVVMFVMTAYFLGLSLGYLVSDRLSQRGILAIGLSTLAIQFMHPFLGRYLVGTLCRYGYRPLCMPALFCLALLSTAPFFALFVPNLITQAGRKFEERESSLVRVYGAEIIGALIALVIILILTSARMSLLIAAQIMIIIVLLVLSVRPESQRNFSLCLFLPLAYICAYPILDTRSAEYYYEWAHGLREPRMAASEFSPYQKVDILMEGREGGGERESLYLNGNRLYGSGRLHTHNLMVSILPNLLKGADAFSLVVAGGSLDNARYTAPQIDHLTVVEIDETVTRLARRYIQGQKGELPKNWRLVIDDAKHFLGSYKGPHFDVIAFDIPIPSYLQTASLYSERFFKLAKSKLSPQGVFSLSLSGKLRSAYKDTNTLSAHLPNRIVAGLRANFLYVKVVEVNRNRHFAYASDKPITWTQLETQTALQNFIAKEGLGVFKMPTISFLSDEDVERAAMGFSPIGDMDMKVVARLSLSKLYDRFYSHENRSR